MHAKLLQSCQILFDPIDCNPPGSSVQGILQERILEWVAAPSSRGFSDPAIKPTSLISSALQQILYPLSHLGSPCTMLRKFKFALKTKETIEVFNIKGKHDSYEQIWILESPVKVDGKGQIGDDIQMRNEMLPALSVNKGCPKHQ